MTIRYFSLREFDSPDKPGSGALMKPHFLEMLDELRHLYGKPLTVVSGYRTPERNAAVSGTGERGPHTTGLAVDLAVTTGADAYILTALALRLGFTGIGLQQNSRGRRLHLDALTEADGFPRPTIWTY